MFCYQCQETAQGKGCILKGVCGKTAEVAGLQDLLMYLMKGISKLTTTLRKRGVESATANKFIVDGLFMTITNANFDSSRFVSKIKEAYQLRENLLNELHRQGIHPSLTCDCLTWKSDKVEEMEVKSKEVGILATENKDIRSLRELLTYGVKGMAAYVEHQPLCLYPRRFGRNDSIGPDRRRFNPMGTHLRRIRSKSHGLIR